MQSELARKHEIATGRPAIGVGTWTPENTPGRIRALLDKFSLSRAELAGEIGASYPCVCHWLTGHSIPSIRHQYKFSELALTLKPKPAPAPEPTTSLLNTPFSVSSWTKENTPERIRAIMKYRKLRNARMARAYMVHPSTVSAWTHGRLKPSPIVRIAIQNFVEAEAAKPKEMDAVEFLMADKDSA